MPRLPPLSQNLNSEPLISPALIAEDNNALRTHTFDDPSIIQDPCPRSGNIYEEQDDQRILGDGDRKIGFEDNVNIKPKLTSISDNNEIRDDITSIKRNGFSQSSEKWKKREVVDQDKIQDDTSQHTKDTVATAIHQLDLQPDAEQGNPSDSLASSVLSREVPASIIPSHIIEKARRKSGKRTQAISIQNPRDDSRETTTKVQSDGSHQTINDLNHTDSGRSADVEPNALQTTSALRQQDDFEAAKKSYRRFKPPLTINTTRGSTVSAASSGKAPFKDAQDIGEIQLPEGRRGKRNKRTVASRQLALANNSEDSGSILQGPNKKPNKARSIDPAGEVWSPSGDQVIYIDPSDIAKDNLESAPSVSIPLRSTDFSNYHRLPEVIYVEDRKIFRKVNRSKLLRDRQMMKFEWQHPDEAMYELELTQLMEFSRYIVNLVLKLGSHCLPGCLTILLILAISDSQSDFQQPFFAIYSNISIYIAKIIDCFLVFSILHNLDQFCTNYSQNRQTLRIQTEQSNNDSEQRVNWMLMESRSGLRNGPADDASGRNSIPLIWIIAKISGYLTCFGISLFLYIIDDNLWISTNGKYGGPYGTNNWFTSNSSPVAFKSDTTLWLSLNTLRTIIVLILWLLDSVVDAITKIQQFNGIKTERQNQLTMV